MIGELIKNMGHLQAFLESGKFGDFLLGVNIVRSTVNPNPNPGPIGPPPPPPLPPSGVSVSNSVQSSVARSNYSNSQQPESIGVLNPLPNLLNALKNKTELKSTIISPRKVESRTIILNQISARGGQDNSKAVEILEEQLQLKKEAIEASKYAYPESVEPKKTSWELKVEEEAKKIAIREENERIKRRKALSDEETDGESSDSEGWSSSESESESDSDGENAGSKKKNAALPTKTTTEPATTSEHTKNIEMLVNYYLDSPKSTKTAEYFYEKTDDLKVSYLPALNNFLQNMVEPKNINVITLEGISNYLKRKLGYVDQQVSFLEPDSIIKYILNDCFFEFEVKEEPPIEFKKNMRGILVYKDAKGEWLTVLPNPYSKVVTMYAYPAENLLTNDNVTSYVKAIGILKTWAGKNGKFLLISPMFNNQISKNKIDAFNNLFLDLSEEEKANPSNPTKTGPPPTLPKPKPKPEST